MEREKDGRERERAIYIHSPILARESDATKTTTGRREKRQKLSKFLLISRRKCDILDPKLKVEKSDVAARSLEMRCERQ